MVNTQSVLHNLALRSISVKDRNSHSWFIYIDKILHKYDLPSLSDLLCLRPASGPWKRYIHARVSNYCLADLQDQARLKSSLRVLCLDRCRIGKPHQVWQNIHTNLDIRRATLKAKILCDVYILQSHRSNFNQYKTDPSCRLCGDGIEDRNHFLLTCSALSAIRSKHVASLYQLHPVLSANLLLESSRIPSQVSEAFERESQKLIHRLHEARTSMLLTIP